MSTTNAQATPLMWSRSLKLVEKELEDVLDEAHLSVPHTTQNLAPLGCNTIPELPSRTCFFDNNQNLIY